MMPARTTDVVPWYRRPAFTTGRVAAILLLALVTFAELHEALR